jgi:hypothetical protein
LRSKNNENGTQIKFYAAKRLVRQPQPPSDHYTGGLH